MKSSKIIALAWPLLAASLSLALPAQVGAQAIYRLLGPDGRVIYTDQPPSPDATAAPGRYGQPAPTEASPALGNLPYDLRQTANRYPVTLYSGPSCTPCQTARSLLQARGVPFTERTVNTVQDGEALKRLSGDLLLPVLTIGSQVLKGLSSSEWQQYLSAAGYPEQSQLPNTYRAPAPAPLVQANPTTPSGTTPAVPLPPPARESPANPAGIVF